MVEYLRGSFFTADPLTGGIANMRGAYECLDALTGGNPNLRGAFLDLDALTGGNPRLRGAFLVLDVLTVLPENPWAAMLVFPTLRGRTWSTHKQPKFSTRISDQQSGQEVRSAQYQYPKWEFDLTYSWLPQTQAQADYQTLLNLFLQCQGSYQYFLYRDYRAGDPSGGDYSVRQGYLGVGDAVTLQFPFARQFVPWQSVADPGGFLEPVGQVDFSTIIDFAPGEINTGTSEIAIAGLATGDGPYFVASTGSTPTGLAADTPYWVIAVDPTHIRLAANPTKAAAGTYIAISSTGSGQLSLIKGFAVRETIAEADNVPAPSGPYTVAVAHAAAFLKDGGVTLAGAPLTAVPGAPGPNQYQVNTATGAYTFNAAQASAAVVITYDYQIDPAAYSILMPNQLLFVSAPAANAIIKADFDFYFVCRFLDDVLDFENFGATFWNLQKCNFTSVPTNPAP